MPPSHKVAYHDETELVQNRLYKSLKVWSMYADLEESFGTFKVHFCVHKLKMVLYLAGVPHHAEEVYNHLMQRPESQGCPLLVSNRKYVHVRQESWQNACGNVFIVDSMKIVLPRYLNLCSYLLKRLVSSKTFQQNFNY